MGSVALALRHCSAKLLAASVLRALCLCGDVSWRRSAQSHLSCLRPVVNSFLPVSSYCLRNNGRFSSFLVDDRGVSALFFSGPGREQQLHFARLALFKMQVRAFARWDPSYSMALRAPHLIEILCASVPRWDFACHSRVALITSAHLVRRSSHCVAFWPVMSMLSLSERKSCFGRSTDIGLRHRVFSDRKFAVQEDAGRLPNLHDEKVRCCRCCLCALSLLRRVALFDPASSCRLCPPVLTRDL